MSGDRKRPRDPQTRLGIVDVKPKPVPELVGKLVLDRYLVVRKLGAGAMGAVYRGEDVKTRRQVAIKVLHDHLLHDPTMLARFRREATAAARLAHENVVGVLDVGETADRTQLMILELASGPSLHDIMTGPLERDRIIRLVKSLLHGLAHAHAAGLIHRDLKPDNVIVDSSTDGREVPRIVDFGIAVLRGPEGGERLTGEGVIIGTPMYMAPEQAKGDEIDHRVDLFALGVIMYEMLSGEPPFSGTSLEIALANINDDPPPVAERAPGVFVDPLLELYARKLMARRIAARFASADEALEVLELVDRDPPSAAIALGKMNVGRALALISLPDPPP
ncbi:MAG: serine/threonine protein kinase [Myxococcales bacterium]|nr:serine/threonine protein kinase [Myxococcales bacterium]